MPQGGDEKFLAKVVERQRGSRVFAGPGEVQSIHSAAFLVRHYAGDVVYDCRGMLEKNADRLSRNLHDMLAGCADGRTRAIFPPKDDRTAGKVTTVGEKFKGQLSRLMASVEQTRPFFIRCIKVTRRAPRFATSARTHAHARTHIVSPSCASCSAHLRVASSHRCSHLLLAPQSNHNKAPNQMEMRMCIEQMTYAGVFEAVKIRKSGYPFRYSHAQFANIYRWISRKANGWTCAAASAPRTIETGRLAEPCASVCRASMAQSAAHHSRVLTTHHAGTGRQADPGRPAARPGALLPGDPGDGAAGLFARPDRPHAGALPRRGAPRPRAAQEPRTRPRLPAHAGKQCNTLSFDDSSRLSATTPCLTTNP